MVFRNVVYVLFLVASCINVSELNAVPGKLSQGQYQVSSQQVYKFFENNSFDFAGHWELFKQGNIDLDILKDMIHRNFQEALMHVNLGKGATVLTLLTNCFGDCAQEPKWLKASMSNSLEACNTQRRKSAQADKKPFTKWQVNSSWAACTQNESANVFFQSFNDVMFEFLHKMQASQDVPQFYLVVRNLKAGFTEQVLIEFFAVPNCLNKNVQDDELKDYSDEDMQEDDSYDEDEQSDLWDLESDLWTAVGERVDGKTQVFLLTAGITCVVIGVFGSIFV